MYIHKYFYGLNPVYCMCVYTVTVDHSRVPLREPDDEGNDYINASYINVRRLIDWFMYDIG